MNARQLFCEATRRALIDERRSNPRSALKAIRAARRMLPDSAGLALAAGECHDALGDFTRARREYAAALALDPSLSPPRARLDQLDVLEDAARALAPSILENSPPIAAVPRRSVDLHPQILSRVSRDGDPMVVLVAEDADLGNDRTPAWGRVDLDRLVSEAQMEARGANFARAR